VNQSTTTLYLTYITGIVVILHDVVDCVFRAGGPTTFHDTVFLMEMNRQLIQAHEAYEKLLFKEALRVGFFELQAARDKYREGAAILYSRARYFQLLFVHEFILSNNFPFL